VFDEQVNKEILMFHPDMDLLPMEKLIIVARDEWVLLDFVNILLLDRN
jgi:hypothetical protein